MIWEAGVQLSLIGEAGVQLFGPHPGRGTRTGTRTPGAGNEDRDAGLNDPADSGGPRTPRSGGTTITVVRPEASARP